MIRIVRTALIFAAGAVGGLLCAAFAARALLIEEVPSAFGVEETVERLTMTAKEEGWILAGVRKLDENVAKNGGRSCARCVSSSFASRIMPARCSRRTEMAACLR